MPTLETLKWPCDITLMPLNAIRRNTSKTIDGFVVDALILEGPLHQRRRFLLASRRLFGNRSFCFERMRLYMKALDDAELSLSMCPGWVKGLFRKGRALVGLKVNYLFVGSTTCDRTDL